MSSIDENDMTVAEGLEFEAPDDTAIYLMSDIFSALADSTRLKILCYLAKNDMNVGSLVEALNTTQPAVSHQLRLLRESGLVSVRRQGQNMIYSFADEHVRTLITVGLEHASEKDIDHD